MKATAIVRKLIGIENGIQSFEESTNQCNFDQTEVFSWTIVNDENEEPEYITLITKNGISMDVLYDENVASRLAAEFRLRNVL